MKDVVEFIKDRFFVVFLCGFFFIIGIISPGLMIETMDKIVLNAHNRVLKDYEDTVESLEDEDA